jgi:hypothetical protein
MKCGPPSCTVAAVADIRPLKRADVPAVLELLHTHMRSWTLDRRVFEGLLLDHPWADAELPSLVADGPGKEIVGFTGVQVRRLRFDGRPIRAVHSGHGVVRPDHRGGALGALLIGRVLKGPQDLTWSDGAADAVARIFQTYGGHLDHARACDWLLVLRPLSWTRSLIAAAARRRADTRRVVPVGAMPFQALGPRLVPRAFPDRPPGVVGEDVTAAAIVEHLSAITKPLRLCVDHDVEHLEHLFGLIRHFGGLKSFQGPLFCRRVRSGERPIGWYAYVARPGGASRVLHVCAPERDSDAVLGELIEHARAQGSAALAGRAEPHLQRALNRRLAVLGYARQPTILTKDPELQAALATSSALVTRLDGDVFSD